jgi:3-oxoacyl-[acyl-carrier-protein] synthase II
MEQDFESRPDKRFSPYALSRWRGNAVSSVVALRHGLSGTVLSLNAASASGAQILWMAGTLIRSGIVDAVVAVAADQSPSQGIASAMGRNGSVAKNGNSAPLSGARSGMTPSEGAACLILESERHAAARSAKPLAEWLGGESRNESRHLQAPDPEGKILEEMIRRSLGEIIPVDTAVDWISLHATGTSRYDAVEASVLGRLFGKKLPWISAFKRTTGHALSASGLLETALLVEGLRSGDVPPPPSGIDESLGLDFPEANSQPVPRIALQIGQGMGGDVVVNLISAIK